MLGCDWGTSSFRLKLVDRGARKIIDEVVSQQGISVMYNKWSEQSATDRLSFYAGYIKENLAILSARTGLLLNRAPIVISGMASSSIGIKELPYAGLPFSTDGSDVCAQWLSGQTGMQNKILLISGVSSTQDLMRGEETQLIGIAGFFDGGAGAEITYIFPGTHSKHVIVKNKRIVHIETYMTGEVFALLIEHSILGKSVSFPQRSALENDESSAFGAGVEKAFGAPLLNSLFSVRVNQLRDYLSKELNYFYLSGLLIGTELKSMQDGNRNKIVICGANKLHDFYQIALQYAGLADRVIVVPAERRDNAAVEGQIKIVEMLKTKPV